MSPELQAAMAFVGSVMLALWFVSGAARDFWREVRSSPLEPKRVELDAPPGPPGEPLVLDLSGAFLLAGHRVHEGEPLEVQLPGGRWLDAELRAEGDGWPALWVTLGGPWEHSDNGAHMRRPFLAARVSPDALMRRPVRPLGGHDDHA